MTQLTSEAGLPREGLSNALELAANPTLEAVMKVADALGFEVAIRPRVAVS